MPVSKVVYGENTVMDITDSTVTPEGLVKGVIAYDAAGKRIVGVGEYVPTDRTINGQALSRNITLFTYGTADIQAGSASSEPEGTLHFVYE